jgi:hypothetical protein
VVAHQNRVFRKQVFRLFHCPRDTTALSVYSRFF